MKNFRYSLLDDGTVKACGYQDFEHSLTGDEPFTGFDIVNYQLVNNEWIYNSIIMIPESISKLQATQHLLNIGRHTELMTIIDSDETGVTRTLYDAAHQLDRDSNMVNQLAEAMGFTQEGIDELFIEASKIMV